MWKSDAWWSFKGVRNKFQNVWVVFTFKQSWGFVFVRPRDYLLFMKFRSFYLALLTSTYQNTDVTNHQHIYQYLVQLLAAQQHANMGLWHVWMENARTKKVYPAYLAGFPGIMSYLAYFFKDCSPHVFYTQHDFFDEFSCFFFSFFFRVMKVWIMCAFK